jgi:hypothetical protein
MGCRKQSQGVANSKSGPKAQDPNKTEEKQKKRKKWWKCPPGDSNPSPLTHRTHALAKLSHTCACDNKQL